MREFLINSGMVIWFLSLCGFWYDFMFDKLNIPEDRYYGLIPMTILWWVLVIWFL